MKIRFIEDREVLDGAGRAIQTFSAGEVYDLPSASARRWLRRKVAEEAGENAAEVTKDAEPEPAPQETEPGEAKSQPEQSPTGSEAGEDQQSSSPQADRASRQTTSKPSGYGRRRGRKKGG